MKLAKKISKGIALCAALTIIGWGGVTSCSNSSSDSDEGELVAPPTLPEKKITFSVTENSTNDENTTLMFKYDRSAAGAKELVKIEDCGIVVKLNDNETKTISTLEFALDEYGASFSESDKNPIKDASNMKEYKAKMSLGKKVAKGDEVVVYYNKDVGTISGEGKDADAVKTLVVALIDTDEAVDYYKPLVTEDNNYQPLFEKKEETGGAGQGNGGNTGAGSGNGDGTGNGDNKNPGGTTGGQGGGNQAGGTGQGNGGGTGAGSGNGDGTGDGDNKNPGGTTGGQGGDTGTGSGSEQDPETPPEESKETVIYKLDFSGAEPPAHNYITEQDNAKFVTNVGVQITGAWAEFAFVPKEMPNLKDATHIKVNFKCSDDAAFDATDKDNNKFMLGGYKYSEEEKKDTNISWTCFLNGATDEFPKDFKVIEKEIKWEQKYDAQGNPIDFANFDDIGGFKIWDCHFTSGTLIVQSVEFIKK